MITSYYHCFTISISYWRSVWKAIFFQYLSIAASEIVILLTFYCISTRELITIWHEKQNIFKKCHLPATLISLCACILWCLWITSSNIRLLCQHFFCLRLMSMDYNYSHFLRRHVHHIHFSLFFSFRFVSIVAFDFPLTYTHIEENRRDPSKNQHRFSCLTSVSSPFHSLSLSLTIPLCWLFLVLSFHSYLATTFHSFSIFSHSLCVAPHNKIYWRHGEGM